MTRLNRHASYYESVKHTTAGALVASALALGSPGVAQAQGELKIGMTAADIPVSFGQPDNGFEGFRFMGLMLYDALVNWDLTAVDKPSGLVPGSPRAGPWIPMTIRSGSSSCARARRSTTARSSTPMR